MIDFHSTLTHWSPVPIVFSSHLSSLRSTILSETHDRCWFEWQLMPAKPHWHIAIMQARTIKCVHTSLRHGKVSTDRWWRGETKETMVRGWIVCGIRERWEKLSDGRKGRPSIGGWKKWTMYKRKEEEKSGEKWREYYKREGLLLHTISGEYRWLWNTKRSLNDQ